MSGQKSHTNQKLFERLRTGLATEEDWKQLSLLLSSDEISRSLFDSGSPRLDTLRAVTRISETLDLSKIAQTAIGTLLKELNADVCAIFRPDLPVFACTTRNGPLSTAESEYQTWNN